MSRPQRAAELRFLTQDRRVWLLPLLLLLVCLPPFLSVLQEARGIASEFDAIASEERSRWLNQNPKNPHSADHFGTWVFKPVSPLSPLDQGLSPYLGRMVRVEAHVFNDAVFQAAQDSNPLMRSDFSSVSGVIQLLLPLAMLILGFASFSGDKERGTIRLALGNGASPRGWVGARLAALALVSAISIAVPLAVLGLVALGSMAGTGWQPGARLVLWLLAYLVYANIFLLLGIAISLVCGTLRTALTAVLLAWFALCIAIPRISTAAVEHLAPTPSYQQTRASIDAETRAFNAAEISAEREQAFIERYGVERAEDLPVDLRGAMLHARDQHDYEVLDRHFGRFFTELEQQERLFGLAGLFSPKTTLEAVSEAVTGNDLANHLRFIWAAEHYRRVLSDTMNDVLMATPQAAGETLTAGREVWERVPPFDYAPLPVARSLGQAAAPLALLLAWLAAMSVLVFVLAGRMKP